jgi:hypothetical protein
MFNDLENKMLWLVFLLQLAMAIVAMLRAFGY